jgi:hypothetical protein
MTARVPRRRFLQVAGLAVVVAACSGADDEATPTTGGMTGELQGGGQGGATNEGSILVALFSTDRAIAAGSEQRLPVAAFTPERTPRRDGDLPTTAAVTINRNGAEVGTTTVDLHGADLPFPYYPVRTTLSEPGLYEVVLDLDDGPSGLMVQAFDPAEVVVPQPGGPMPVVGTPTTADPEGVDPICTRFEPCPLHATSLDQVLGTGPVALLVGTPAYCQTGVCGPVLDQLLAAAPEHPGVTMIHAEVYANPREVDGNIADPRIRPAPVMSGLALAYEPVLFVIDAAGTITERFDNVYDQRELAEALRAVT